MKKVLIIAFVVFILMIPMAAYSQSRGAGAQTPPPVAPPLVREGDFAVKLVGGLNIGTAKDETEAESILVGVGIAPRNGWISDYPMTPDIIVEVQKAIGDAADAKRLPMGKEEALKAFQTSAVELEIPMIGEGPSGDAESQPPTTPQYTEPSVVNNYYYGEGPPVFTYYPPPWDYYYLYAWVPFPFYWTGFFFPGFFILNDFDRFFFVHGHRFFVTNHFFDRDHHRFSTIDPVNRWRGGRESLRASGGRSEGRGFATAEARRGAGSIRQRSDRMMASREATGRNFGTSRGQNTPSFNGPGGARGQIARGQNFRGTPGGSQRSFGAPGRSGGRSFSPPPMRSQGPFFSPPSMGGRSFPGSFRGGSGSFSGFSGGVHGGGGGFGHVGSFGGFQGGGGGGFRGR